MAALYTLQGRYSVTLRVTWPKLNGFSAYRYSTDPLIQNMRMASESQGNLFFFVTANTVYTKG